MVRAAGESEKNPLIAKSRDVDEQSIRSLGEACLGLKSAFGDVAVNAFRSRLFAIRQSTYLIVGVARKGELKQRLEVHSGNALRPAFCRVSVKMTSEVESSSLRWDVDTRAFSCSLHGLVIARGADSSRCLRVTVLDP